ncbi:MAG TPA: sigma-70 family RNA polymerase sigma factor [Candidatus Nitrosopolaris sp.]|nr:sigma-70 family RNA polymerase sigma factor [Candidatus Nitrosopolaris sp.]
MMNYPTVNTEEYTDTELVSRTLAGDRDAFSRIVSRYQILICSLAYSRIGHLGQSEDVAQETFITAWKHLRLLREPAKLRAWLCGIVHNRIHKTLRREGREPVHLAEPLDIVHDSPASEALPSEQTISREEEAILWRSLEKIPELYREPLVLFYREHESIETVAAQLDLSEDAVKQRLSRGRKLLQEEVQAFVENTLRRTAPGQAFSGAVLAALPAAPTAAGVSLAGKGATAAKTGFLGAWLAPIIGILGGMLAHWLIFRAAPTAAERRLKKIAFISLWVFVLAWCIAGQLGLRALGRHLAWSDRTLFVVLAGFWWFYAVVVATLCIVMFRRILAIRQQHEGAVEAPPGRSPWKPGRSLIVTAGVYLACFWWLIDLAWRANDMVSAAIITATMVALGGSHFFQVRGKTGVAAVRTVAGHLAVAWAIILLILNCRVGTWAASLGEIDPAEMSSLLPLWLIPALTLALLFWIGLVLVVTNPKHRAQEKVQA